MKKEFTAVAEEFISGIQTPDTKEPETTAAADQGQPEPEEITVKPTTAELPPKDFYIRYVEPRSERVQVLFSKSLKKKLAAEAKKRKMSMNGLINEILESYFNDSGKE